MTIAGQTAVSYNWDNANRLTGITQASAGVSLAYDNANRRAALTLPNGIVLAYSYDHDSRVTGMTWTLGTNEVGDLEYSYDADGRVAGKTGSLAQSNTPTPASGNAFNADNAMTGFNGTTLTYDNDGNLTADGTNTYTWDVRNHLSAMSGAVAASFVYDAFGRRMSKTISGTTTQFLYDRLNPVQELDGSSPPNVTANLLTGLGIDEYYTRTASGTTSTLLADALGSTIGLVTANNGSIATSYTYQPFGATTASGTTNGNSYQFTGRENDGTGLYFYRARYHSPRFQRFVGQDPIEFRGGDSNLYGYAGNSPTNFVDPQGLLLGIPYTWGLLGNLGAAGPGSLVGGVAGATGGALAGAALGETIGPTLGLGSAPQLLAVRAHFQVR